MTTVMRTLLDLKVLHQSIGTQNQDQGGTQGESLFHTRCLVQNKVCSLIIDQGSCTNIASSTMVEKLSLKTMKHPEPYKLQWLTNNEEVAVTRQVMVSLSIGRYEDEILCDVLPMEVSHILLGKPWQSERQATFHALAKRYCFKFKNRKTSLVPLSSLEAYPDQQTKNKTEEQLAYLKKSFEGKCITFVEARPSCLKEVLSIQKPEPKPSLQALKESVALQVDEDDIQGLKEIQPHLAIQAQPSVMRKKEEIENKSGEALHHGHPYGVVYPLKDKPSDSFQPSPANGSTVSRSKLFQEEEHDVILTTPKKGIEPCSSRTKLKINYSSQTTIWETFLPPLSRISKWNQYNQSSDEEFSNFTLQANPRLNGLDLQAFNDEFQPSQKESCYEVTFPGILIHSRSTESWNRIKRCSNFGDMDFTKTWKFHLSGFSSVSKLMLSRSTQIIFGPKPTWRSLMGLLSFQQAQKQKHWPSEHKDTPHLPEDVQLLSLTGFRPIWLRNVQTYVWQPGYVFPAPLLTKTNEALILSA